MFYNGIKNQGTGTYYSYTEYYDVREEITNPENPVKRPQVSNGKMPERHSHDRITNVKGSHKQCCSIS